MMRLDVTVNTGLGAGTRERDMAVMQMVGGIQEKLLAAYGPVNNPFVTPQNVFNALARLIEASGLRSVDQYFTRPDPARLAQMQQQAAQKPDPAVQKMQAEMQATMMKARIEAQADARRLEIDREIRLAEIKGKAELQRYQIDQEIALKREQMAGQALYGQTAPPVRIGGEAG